jgi:tyrosyl-tRNA synthetase
MDPTAPDITLGHAVPLKIIRQVQDWGHRAVLIIGDYTARVGDPSGRSKTRPQLSGEEIDANAKTYVSQVGKILLTDPQHLEIRFNGEWFAKMTLLDILKLTSKKSVAQMLERDDFKNRYTTGVDIRIHEFLYPLKQGQDRVMIDIDVEMGGSDQLYNNLVGRDLQEDAGKPGQAVIVTPLLVGLDGVKKMSKSLKNYIAVTDPPGGQEGMFGKIMSLPDALMEPYYQLLTDLPMEDVRRRIQSSPRDAKVALAKHLIAWLHDQQAADAAEAQFLKQFVKHEAPDEMPENSVADMGTGPHKVAPLLVKAGLASSNSEGTRKIKEGAVSIDGEKVSDVAKTVAIDKATVLKLGRKYARLLP